MPTTVVNIHHGKRCDISIMRPSIWGNPFSHLPNSRAEFKVDTREQAVERHMEWVLEQPALLARLPELKDKTLGCCCKPKACHGDNLIWLVENIL